MSATARSSGTLLLVFGLAWLATCARAEPPTPVRTDHPILGNWRFTMPDGKCTETYPDRQDGTRIVTSGDEVSESVFEIADQPDGEGRYRLVDRIVRNNGRPDCGGKSTPAGDVATLWVRFDATREHHIVCFDETLNSCFGPFVRVRPQTGRR